MRAFNGALLAGTALAICLPVSAGELLATGPLVSPEQLAQASGTAATSKGYKAGSLIFNPGIDVTEYYDDNIFATRTNEKSDFITVVTPSLGVESDWEKHQARFETGANIGRYTGNSAENYEDYWVGADGRFDISPKSNLFAGSRYSRNHEERESPDDIVGTEPTAFDLINSYAGGFHRFDQLAVRIGGTHRKYDFEDTPALAGNINNDDRDRNQYTGGANVSYRFTNAYRAFVEGATDIRRYNSSVDDNGFNRDSDGYRLSAGVRFDRETVKGRVFAGYMKQEYDDPALSDVGAPTVGGNLRV